MAITQLNTADYDYAMMLNVINKSYKGKADITLSAYDTTAAPDVKVGSVFEDNGAIFIVDSSDITPSGYAGITNSTIFYLYYDEDPGAFIYSSTAPTWSDVLQGWYNSDDRAFFSIYKDSGGTLYQAKNKLEQASNLLTKIIPIGDWDMSTATGTTTVNVTHGITSYLNIRNVTATIIGDNGTTYLMSNGLFSAGSADINAGVGSITSTLIVLVRLTGGTFDADTFNATSFNRGWVTIWYVE